MVSVELRGVSVVLGGREIIRGVTATFDSGLNAVIGPNGAGKTTLLRLLAGVLRPTAGEVEIRGARGNSRGLLAYVPAQHSLDPMARVRDVAEAMGYGSPRWSFRRFVEWLSAMGLEWSLDVSVGRLSSGEQRMALMAAALARDPELLVIDEPLAFLDVKNQVKVMEILRELSLGGRTVVVAMHELGYVSLADRVLVLSRGVKVAEGRPQDVLSEDLLSKVYGVRFESVRSDGLRWFVPAHLFKEFSK